MRWRLLVPVLALATAGCLGSGSGPEGGSLPDIVFDPLWSETALAFGDGHDHTDRSLHLNLSTPNFEVVGFDPLLSEHYGGRSAGGYLCGDASEAPDGTRLVAVESRSEVGVAFADVTNASAPRWLGEIVMKYTYVYDVAVVPDGRHAVLVTAQGELPVEVPPGEQPSMAWRDACTGSLTPLLGPSTDDPVPRPSSVILLDILASGGPAIVDHQPLVGNGHGVLSARIDDRVWVMIATTRAPVPATPASPVPIPVPGEAGDAVNRVSVYEFYELSEGPAGPRLNLLSVYKPPPDPEPRAEMGSLMPRAHDGWLAKHPGTGKVLAYLAGGHRFTVLDLSDPTNPREVGRWSDWSPERDGYSSNLHSVYPLPELWEGRHFTLLGPEFGGHPVDHPSGILWVLDTTDPAKPFAVAGWTLPHEVEWSGTYMFSNHYFTVVDRTAFISMYHGGVWALDLSGVGGAQFTLLPSVGVFLPDRAPPLPAAVEVRWAPTVEEVLSFSDGTLVTFDGNAGLYTFRFDATKPAPAPEPWPVAPYGTEA